MRYFKILKHTATTVTDENGKIYKIADNEQLKKLDSEDCPYHYVAENQFGICMLTDRPEGSMFSDLRKRDEPTFSQALSRLPANYVGTEFKTLAKGAGINPDVDRAARAVSMIKVATDSRRSRNSKIQRALRKAANSEYETPIEAKTALRKALISEGFERTAMRKMGF
jgi:hypothetical protein